MKSDEPHCAQCPFDTPKRVCRTEAGKGPPSCPTLKHADLVTNCMETYGRADVEGFAFQCSVQEGQGYAGKELGYDHVRPAQPRIAEIAAFARKMDYRRLGLAFCIGLRNEAKVVERFYAAQGFEMVSVMCKAGGVAKERIGIEEDQKVTPGTHETMCNPVFQAELMNLQGTDFNVVMGLCVGHDSLFFRHANAPCTVLAVKDRLLGHNPLAAVYTLDSYYRYLKAEPQDEKAGG